MFASPARIHITWLTVALSVIMLSVGQKARALQFTNSMTSAGLVREFVAYIPPSYTHTAPMPLLFMMHGLTGSGRLASIPAPNGSYQWQTMADKEGFIVLFPTSYGDDQWDMHAADVAFVRDMISWATHHYNIRTTHIFSTGHSFGAFFSYFIAVQLRNDVHKITAFAAHSGGLGPGTPNAPPTLKGMLIHATGDPICQYSWSEALDRALTGKGHISEFVSINASNHNWYRDYNQTQWEFFMAQAPALYAITYRANGATSGTTPPDQIKTHDEPWILDNNSGNLVQAGHLFADWNTAANGSGTSYAVGASYTSNSVLTLYAQWTDDDVDTDGMSDIWEKAHGLSILTNDASAHYDEDGADNYTEYIADTDPMNSSSVFELNLQCDTNMTVSWSSSSNRLYSLAYTTNSMDADPWTSVSQMSLVPGTGGVMVYTNPAPGGPQIFRASVSLPQ